MRISKHLTTCGVSRRASERLISEGAVSVNGMVLLTPVYFVKENDVISIHNKIVKPFEQRKIWCFHKPPKLITTHKDPEGRPTVFDYVKTHHNLDKILSVGRLDYYSEGLMLLTNDPAFAHEAEHPSNQWKRLYRVRFFGSPDSLSILKDNVQIKGITYHLKVFDIVSGSGSNHWATVELWEGKNREIRRCFEYCGLEVSRLIRIQYGPYMLDDLEKGDIKEVC